MLAVQSLEGSKAIQEIMPSELLVPPHRDEARRLDREASALLLDHYLRRLASQEARGRRALGTIASEFLRRQAHHALGFARLDDYARERIGLSAREVQTTARVIAALPDLPLLSAAFERGALSWTQLRLLVVVSRPATQHLWLNIAHGRTVRALEATIRATNDRARLAEGAGAAPLSTHAVTEALEDCAEDGFVTDGESTATLRVRCPRWVAPLWRETVELAGRVAGEPLASWRAAEAIAAEGLAAPRAFEPSRHDATDALAPSVSGSFAADGSFAAADRDETRATFSEHAAFDAVDWSAVVEALPNDVEELARELTACDAHELDRRLRAAARALRRVDWQLGRLLRLFLDRRLYLAFGFTSGSRYTRERLGIETRRVRMLVAIERKTWLSPPLMDAYRDGILSPLQALSIAPVVDGSAGAAWVVRATEVTLRRLAAEVGWALDVRDANARAVSVEPPPHGASLDPPTWDPPTWQMRAPCGETLGGEIVVRGPVSVISLLRTAIAAFHAPLTPAWTGLVNLLAHAKAEWERLPRHRDPVFARDGWRCAVPACSSRRNLHDHHILYRSRGGDNARDNRITLCAWHHLRGVHDGRIRAWGSASGDVHWELGVRQHGPALLQLVGDRYERASTSNVHAA